MLQNEACIRSLNMLPTVSWVTLAVTMEYLSSWLITLAHDVRPI